MFVVPISNNNLFHKFLPPATLPLPAYSPLILTTSPTILFMNDVSLEYFDIFDINMEYVSWLSIRYYGFPDAYGSGMVVCPKGSRKK